MTSGTDSSDAVRPGGTSVWFTVSKQTGGRERETAATEARMVLGVDLEGAW